MESDQSITCWNGLPGRPLKFRPGQRGYKARVAAFRLFKRRANESVQQPIQPPAQPLTFQISTIQDFSTSLRSNTPDQPATGYITRSNTPVHAIQPAKTSRNSKRPQQVHSIWTSADNLNRIRQIAKQSGVPINHVINQAINRYLESTK